MVIHAIKKDELIIADPGKGIVKYTKEEFGKIWTGVLAVQNTNLFLVSLLFIPLNVILAWGFIKPFQKMQN